MNAEEMDQHRPATSVMPGDRAFVATPAGADARARALIQALNDTGGITGTERPPAVAYPIDNSAQIIE
ncbi:hypothetical protein pneo_cds_386 [Pandoravirus neocaledonia]|uniref:Uncharacterized protein n=1 Tax=Pandoravirus neocaledonia TaxID=2107708 RepID=A0A2U7UC32_9VIRU|nr:hypothetical protein pneo_cds_386 [Pandoravirus neocaledonia]AVK75993.1 hypothetical protein pneo_cds_386 [Pandoravirus neocaledonia]